MSLKQNQKIILNRDIMRKILLLGTLAILLAACNTKQRYTQDSPEITTYKKVMEDYENKNWEDMALHYADTAKILNNVTLKNAITIKELIASNKEDSKLFTWKVNDKEFEMVVTDKGETWVNFWGVWQGTQKATSKLYEIPFHITARFVNNKIVRELGYWDVSKIVIDSYESQKKSEQKSVEN